MTENGGGVTAPRGFRAAGVACGIRRERPDVALLVCDDPASAAGLFTTNKAQAAPVVLSRAHLARSEGRARAIVVNSGCANACTGEAGMAVAEAMAAETGRLLDCAAEQVLVASTGVIGADLDRGKVTAGIREAAARLSRAAHRDAAEAILTTDRSAKETAAEAELSGGRVLIGGMAKGAGMIEPRLATMLAFVTTDAAVPPPLLARALAEAAAETFNAITIDGDTSTNDSVFVLASGASGVAVDERSFPAFATALTGVCRTLAIEIVRGGEGVTKVAAIRIVGAASADDARQAARTVANSALVKTAIHGGDPNWGRLVAAAGRAGVPFVLERAGVKIGPVVLFSGGQPFDERAADAARVLDAPDVEIEVDLGTGGRHAATMWTCDLSAEYVRINADYRT